MHYTNTSTQKTGQPNDALSRFYLPLCLDTAVPVVLLFHFLYPQRNLRAYHSAAVCTSAAVS